MTDLLQDVETSLARAVGHSDGCSGPLSKKLFTRSTHDRRLDMRYGQIDTYPEPYINFKQ